jgi:hypothetical protein
MNRWKRTAQLGVGFGVLALVCGGWVHGRAGEVEAARDRLATLREQVARLRREAGTQRALELQLQGLNAAFADYVQILPAPQLATEEELLRQISRVCDRRRVRLSHWRRQKNSRRRARKGRAPFRETRLQLQLEAKLPDLILALNDLERLPKLVRVIGFALRSPDPLLYDGVDPPLEARVEVSTFCYQG